jgi:hypothetical protein
MASEYLTIYAVTEKGEGEAKKSDFGRREQYRLSWSLRHSFSDRR